MSFLISCFFSKPVIKQQGATRTGALAVERKMQADEQEFAQNTQLKDNFLLMASHELKTPMTTIVGQAQLMLRCLSRLPELSPDLVTMRTALESIDGQTRRLNALVDELLDLHNIRAGEIELKLQTCDLVEVCREAVADQRRPAGRAIVLDVPAAPVILQANADRLGQVVVNLVSNAIKFSPGDSPVRVLVDQRRDRGIIEVTDVGQGIPKDQQTRIFEPFYRGPDVQTTSQSGLGLGLAICEDIVERHGGRICCQSRVGKGSTFIVELPLNKNVTQKVH